ncbi:MAG: sugar ABC transporter ATP-binding protein [Pseudomonadota bacterium]
MTDPMGSQHLTVQQPLLKVSNVCKEFPGVKALNQVSLELYAGTVTALIGENGAGKSTLVKVLTGIYQPDSGEISLAGQTKTFGTAHEAALSGITAIHQETVLFDELSVAENIFLGNAPSGRLGLIDTRAMKRQATQLLQRVNANIDPDTPLRELGIANKHLVAVARALSVDSQVVIMDEPTAALSLKEIEELYTLIEQLKQEGKAILFISHKFDEIFAIADLYTVYRDGEMAGSGNIADTTQDELVQMMVGRPVDQVFPARTLSRGSEVLRVEGYCHPTEFADISFTLAQGEILGFYGLVGAGRTEFMQSLFGITRPSAGKVFIEGEAATISAPKQAIDKGIVYVPEDRGHQGTISNTAIFQNVSLPSLGNTLKRHLLNPQAELSLTREFTERLELRAAALDQHVNKLSGGNQQKVVIAKWLATKPKIIILDEPTKGIDIGSKAAVHHFTAELAAQGVAVILVSSEIPEVIGMSDRVIVMRDGRICAEINQPDMTPAALVQAAAGIGSAA